MFAKFKGPFGFGNVNIARIALYLFGKKMKRKLLKSSGKIKVIKWVNFEPYFMNVRNKNGLQLRN